MKAYSVDLRQKIIDAHNQQEGLHFRLGDRLAEFDTKSNSLCVCLSRKS